jgi:hypothetical protein
MPAIVIKVQYKKQLKEYYKVKNNALQSSAWKLNFI